MSNNLINLQADCGPQPQIWQLESNYKGINVAAPAGYQMTGAGEVMSGVVIDLSGKQSSCEFTNNWNNSWNFKIEGKIVSIWYFPARLYGVFVQAGLDGTWTGYYQDENWNKINIKLIPDSSTLIDSLSKRTYSAGSVDMTVWAGPITNSFSVCRNNSSHTNLMNAKLRSFEHISGGSYDFFNNDFIEASFNNPPDIDTSKWMTQLWSYINHMPAREFLFIGCHNALASYGGTDEGYGKRSGTQSGTSYTQDRKITAMLNDGCRFFDVRFENEWGHHSGVNFDIDQTGFVTELSNFFTTNNANEIVIINLDIRDTSSNTGIFYLTSLYTGFDALVTSIGKDKIIPIQYHNVSANPSSTLGELRAAGNVIFMVNSGIFSISGAESWTPPGNNFWSHQMQDAVPSYADAITAIDYYNDIINQGIINVPILGNVFNYLSLTATFNEKKVGNNITNNDFAQAMNGPMADWLLNATEINNSMLPYTDSNLSVSTQAKQILQLNGFNNITLPYKLTQIDQTLYKNRNFNMVAVDFYEKGPFIINSIVQNLLAANYIRKNPTPVSIPLVSMPQIGTLQNNANKGYRTANATQLSGGYNTDCDLKFIPQGKRNGIYAIQNVSNSGFYQSSIQSLASSASGNDQFWYIIPASTAANNNLYFVKNVANGGFMTRSAASLSGSAGFDEIWIIQGIAAPAAGLPQFGSLQNVSNKGFRTTSATALDSNYNSSCLIQFISNGINGQYLINNVSNGGYYQSSIQSLASKLTGNGNDQYWLITPSGTGTDQYYVKNVANDGYMTSRASQLSSTAGPDEVWIIVARPVI